MSLPPKIQEHSLHRYAQDNELKAAFYEASKDVNELTSLERYKIYLRLQERLSDVPKSRLFQACGLAPSREKALAEPMNKPDPYAEIRHLIVEIYQAYS